jgi:hypothetical protein
MIIKRRNENKHGTKTNNDININVDCGNILLHFVICLLKTTIQIISLFVVLSYISSEMLCLIDLGVSLYSY